MKKAKTTRYDVAEHMRTSEEMAAYLVACREEGKGDAAFIAKGLKDIARANDIQKKKRQPGFAITSEADLEQKLLQGIAELERGEGLPGKAAFAQLRTHSLKRRRTLAS